MVVADTGGSMVDAGAGASTMRYQLGPLPFWDVIDMSVALHGVSVVAPGGPAEDDHLSLADPCHRVAEASTRALIIDHPCAPRHLITGRRRGKRRGNREESRERPEGVKAICRRTRT